VWGALRGLESFAQALLHNEQEGPNAYFADEQTVEDRPHYTYRGLMVDTARHFLPLNMLFAIVDGTIQRII
jgi:hexosaminidase